MDHAQEQREELETLSYIYSCTELEMTSPTTFCINCTLDPSTLPPTNTAYEQEYTFTIRFTLTPTYPQTPPQFTIALDENLRPISADVKRITDLCMQDAVQYAASESQCIYTLITTITDLIITALITLTTAAPEIDEEVPVDADYVLCDAASFSGWKLAFLEEAKGKSSGLKRGETLSLAFVAVLGVADIEMDIMGAKPSGRQMFERDRVGMCRSDEKYVDDGGDDVVYSKSKDQEVAVEEDEDNLVLIGLSIDD